MTRRRARHSSTPPGPGFRRQPRIADQMTPDYYRLVEASDAAQRDGDAATALEYHQAVPMFARSAHRVQLMHLAGLSGEMTPWLWARWAAYQATRAEGPECGDVLNAAFKQAVGGFYQDRLVQAWAEGTDPMRVVAVIMGESWVFHQLSAYDLGGLERFLDRLATGRLAAGCTLAREWASAPMGGYRVAAAGPGVLTVHDLRADRCLDLLDLGASVCSPPGSWVVGRVVASGTTPESMFDSRAVRVDERTARQVARAPEHWLRALRRAVDAGRVDRDELESEDRELTCDVPSLELVRFATPPPALSRTLDQLARGRDEIGRAAFRVLERVAQDRLGPDSLAPYVAAAVLNPHAHAEAWRRLATSAPTERWAHWADLVADPARARLRRLADSMSSAA